MTDQTSNVRRAADGVVALAKYVAATGTLGGVAVTIWLQIWGGGIAPWLQNSLGVTEINMRLAFIERFMEPPNVVDWNEDASFQSGTCTSERCIYVLNGARTEYGDSCGLPSGATPYVRTSDGRTMQIGYDGFQPVELDRQPRSFSVPLAVPEFVPPGAHQWRVRVVYPTCPGFNEPVPRWTPWFPLQVSMTESQ